MLPALLALVLAAPASEPGRVVTLNRLLPELRAPGDPELFLAPELKNEAIYLRGTSTTDLPRLRALVARAVSAEWVSTGAALKLERSPALRKRLREAELAALTTEFERALGTSERPAPTTYEEYARLRQLLIDRDREGDRTKREYASGLYEAARARLDPRLRTGARLRAALDPAFLAALPLGRTMRYLGAGGFPRPPFDAAALLRAFRADSEIEAAGSPTPESDPFADALRRRRDAVIASSLPGLVVTRWPDGAFDARLYAVGATGEAYTIGEVSAYATPSPSDGTLWPGETPAISARLLDAIPRPKPKEVAPLLRKGGEPLTLVAPTLDAFLDALSEAGPAVLDLPDGTVNLAYRGTVTASEISRGLRQSLSARREGSALVGTPRLPLETASVRFPRAEVAPWYALVTRRDATLDECAALAARVGDGPTFNWMENTVRTLAGASLYESHPWGSGVVSRKNLRLWASLRPSIRAALDAGRVLSLTELPPDARRAALDVVVRFGVDTDTGPVFLDRDDRTPEVALSWKPAQTPSIFVPEGPSADWVTSPQELGLLMAQQSRGERLDPDRLLDVRTARLRPALLTSRTLLLRWAPEPVFPPRANFSEVTLSDTPAVGWESLPPELLTPLRKAYEQERGARGGG